MIRDDKHTFKILISYQEIERTKQKVEVEYLHFKESRTFALSDHPGQDAFIRNCLDFIAREYFHLIGEPVYRKNAVR